MAQKGLNVRQEMFSFHGDRGLLSAMMQRMPTLDEELATLDRDLLVRLENAGFRRELFLELAATLRHVGTGEANERRRARNVVRGHVQAPPVDRIAKLPPVGSADHARLRERGIEAIRSGELAFCTMAGGMATRMGGIVKALAEAAFGRSFLELRLAENRVTTELAGSPVPLWLMTSEATHAPIVKALDVLRAPPHVAVFMQNLSMRLQPDGQLFRDASGQPSLYATGHGDLVDALRRSGLLERFVANGGKWVWITNIDNLGASVDPVVLGHFIETSTEHAYDVQCEVCRKEGDKGGIPVLAEGKLQVLEEFRLPSDFDPTTVNVFNTNTFLVRAEPLASRPLDWTYFEVEKVVGGEPAIQFERLLQEITAQMPSTYLEVPRDGEASRFLPAKNFEELATRRADIERVARSRGMI